MDVESGEFDVAVETWSEICAGEIPIDDLEAAYKRAMRDKESGFTLTPDGLVQGYRAMVGSERWTPRIPENKDCVLCYGLGRRIEKVDGYNTAVLCDHIVKEPEADLDDVSMF